MSADRVLIAPDKFKGSLTAHEVAGCLAEGVRSVRPDLDTVLRPIADGGEGTLLAAVAAGWQRVDVTVTGPLPGVTVHSGFATRGARAVVELADAVGLQHLDRPAPLDATTVGLGELVAAALDHGCHEVVVGLGGSASTDGGLGLLATLGAVARDAHGAALVPSGRSLAALDRLDLTGLDPRLASTTIVVASDVDSPLYGPHGAAHTYAAQKGATSAEIALLDDGLRRMAAALHAATGRDVAVLPGAGAAGGTAAALTALGGRVTSGADLVFDLVGIDAELDRATAVITGEGRLDGQSLRGKGPVRLARRARDRGIPAIAVAGDITAPTLALAESGFRHLYALTTLAPRPGQAIRDARDLLYTTGRAVAAVL